MAEDFDDHRRVFDGGDDLQGAAAVGAVFHVDVGTNPSFPNVPIGNPEEALKH
jgi:hypothetical protein